MVPRLQLRSIGTTMLPGSRPSRWDYELEMSYEFSTARPQTLGLSVPYYELFAGKCHCRSATRMLNRFYNSFVIVRRRSASLIAVVQKSTSDLREMRPR